MSWNFRVISKNGEDILSIHEVYYDEKGKIIAITKDAIEPIGNDLNDLKKELQHMLEACDKEILNYDRIFPSKPKSRSKSQKKSGRNK